MECAGFFDEGRLGSSVDFYSYADPCSISDSHHNQSYFPSINANTYSCTYLNIHFNGEHQVPALDDVGRLRWMAGNKDG